MPFQSVVVRKISIFLFFICVKYCFFQEDLKSKIAKSEFTENGDEMNYGLKKI